MVDALSAFVSLLFTSIFPTQGAQTRLISKQARAISLFSLFFLESNQRTYPWSLLLQSGNSSSQKSHLHSVRFHEPLSEPIKIFKKYELTYLFLLQHFFIFVNHCLLSPWIQSSRHIKKSFGLRVLDRSYLELILSVFHF